MVIKRVGIFVQCMAVILACGCVVPFVAVSNPEKIVCEKNIMNVSKHNSMRQYLLNESDEKESSKVKVYMGRVWNQEGMHTDVHPNRRFGY